MKTYENKFGLLAFSIDGVDYIFDLGDKRDLPSDEEIIKNYVAKGYLVEVDKPSKTQK